MDLEKSIQKNLDLRTRSSAISIGAIEFSLVPGVTSLNILSRLSSGTWNLIPQRFSMLKFFMSGLLASLLIRREEGVYEMEMTFK
jgi:hypothetical protein